MRNFTFIKKIIVLSFFAFLIVQCQRDESTNVEANGEQPATQMSQKQLQTKAKEILNSEEWKNYVSQNRSFYNKIHDDGFITRDLFDEGLEYDDWYDTIQNRLPMTSFKSVEEVMEGDEKAYNSIMEFLKKYPEFLETPGLSEEVVKIRAENSKKEFLEDLKKKQWISKCEQRCRYKRHACSVNVENVWLIEQFKCAAKVIGAVCRINPWKLVKGCECFYNVYQDYKREQRECTSEYNSCSSWCQWK